MNRKDAHSTKILLVDDDDAFRPALQKSLEALGFHITPARHGKDAQQLLEQVDVDLVISDIRMPEMDGIALTQHIKTNFTLPVILMTGFSEILETQEAYRLGADEFIPKPFEKDEMLEAIARCIGRKNEIPVFEDEYLKVAVNDFTSGRQIQCAIFVRFSDQKFVKVAHCGEDLSSERIYQYQSKGLRFLYLRREDFRKYVGFDFPLTRDVKRQIEKNRERKFIIMPKFHEILAKSVPMIGAEAGLIESARCKVDTSFELLCDEPSIFDMISTLVGHTDYLFAHSIATAVYATMIATHVGWTLPTNKFKVASGGLLHDIGQLKVTADLLSRGRDTWSMDDVSSYETHPTIGYDLLKAIPAIPEDVLMIVKEHHEDNLSLGFPSHLRRTQLHPMAKLMAVANEFSNRVVKNPHYPQMKIEQAIEDLLAFRAENLDTDFLSALLEIFKIDVPKGFLKRKQV